MKYYCKRCTIKERLKIRENYKYDKVVLDVILVYLPQVSELFPRGLCVKHHAMQQRQKHIDKAKLRKSC